MADSGSGSAFFCERVIERRESPVGASSFMPCFRVANPRIQQASSLVR